MAGSLHSALDPDKATWTAYRSPWIPKGGNAMNYFFAVVLDPRRFAATGGSTEAGISLWLGFHEDMADAKSPDPVLRQYSPRPLRQGPLTRTGSTSW
jgi:hypothetical protein